MSDIESIETTVTSITIPDWTCNDSEFVKFDFSQFTQLQSLEIGDDCFGFVNVFRINGLNLLKRLKIGKNSFTLVKEPEIDGNSDEAEGKMNNAARSFHITNCEQLESIRIAECSFCDFAGEFELGNLPALKTLKIGTIGRWFVRGSRCAFIRVLTLRSPQTRDDRTGEHGLLCFFRHRN